MLSENKVQHVYKCTSHRLLVNSLIWRLDIASGGLQYQDLCSELSVYKQESFTIISDLRPSQEYFTYMETISMPVKGCKI
jgi:hypothetical protein